MSRLTQPQPSSPYRDLVLAAWVAANTSVDLGRVRLAEPIVLWSAAGDEEVGAATYELSQLGALMVRPAPVPLALDVWCRATGFVTSGSWAALGEHEFAEQTHSLADAIRRHLYTVSALAERCPAVFAWIVAATHVVRPLVPVPGVARSSHDPGIPGLVELDLSRGPTQTIELLVHETAHLHLRAAEAKGPLVDPGHSATYRSPLRTEPRPLIGILLAYHALAYICAALEEAAAGSVVDIQAERRALPDLGRRRDDARAVVDGAHGHLTETGAEFVDRTHEVAEYVPG
jgi:HEXXH motif-containing protein